MYAWCDEVEFKMLGVEGKDVQKINPKKEGFSPAGAQPFDVGKALEMGLS